MIGIGLAQFRNVVGNRAAVLGRELRMAMIEEPQQRRPGAGPVARLLRRGRLWDIYYLSSHAMVSRGGFYVASASAETAQAAFIRGRCCGIARDRGGLRSQEWRSPVPRQPRRR